MKYFRNTTEIEIKEESVITLGKFDGLHSGHQFLLEELTKQKVKHNLKSVIFTFVTPPLDEIEKKKHKLLLTLAEKEYLFRRAQIDYLIEYPFNQEVMKINAEAFVAMLVEKLNVRVFIVGTDFNFGYQRQGDYHLLKRLAPKYGYEVIVVQKKQYQGQDISSTLIRNCIMEDKLLLANRLLDYTYFMQGTVEEGNKLGRTMGIPTINLIPEEEKMLPSFGVYATKVSIDEKEYYGLTNIGRKPTVGKDNPVGVETHVFGFHEMVYGKLVTVSFLEKIREEKKFNSIDELRKQIEKDICEISVKYYKCVT